MKFGKRRKQARIGGYLIAFLAAAMVCFTIAGNVRAETIPDTQPTGTTEETTAPVTEATDVPTENLAANQEASEDISTEPTIPTGQMNQIVDSLAALLSEAEQTKYDSFLQELRNDSLYAKPEVFTALEKMVQLLNEKRVINEAVLQIKEQLAACTDLDDISKEAFLSNMTTLLAGLAADPMDMLSRCLDGISQDPPAPVDAAILDSQLQLAAQIKTTVDGYPNVLRNLSSQAAEQQALIQDLNAEIQSGGRKLLLVYIALAVSGLGIVMSIIATVFSVHKPKETPVDLSATASRDDVEALQRQNQILNSQCLLQEEKLNQLSAVATDVDTVKCSLVGMEKRLSDIENKLPAQKEEIIQDTNTSSEMKRGSPVSKPALKCYLRLNYQSLSPDLSVLIPDSNGEYALYEDGSILPREPLQGTLNQFNSLAGWTSTGMLYLFNPQLDGIECSSGSLPASQQYYKVGQVLRPASAKANGGNYQLQAKGCIRMESL